MSKSVSPVEFYDAQVGPALFQRLDQAFPEFGWVRTPRGWKATAAGEDVCQRFLGASARRVECRDGDAFFAHGAERCTWTRYVNGGQTPSGKQWIACVVRLCELVGVDHSPLTSEDITDEQREAWKKQNRDAATKAAERRKADELEQRRLDEREIEAARALWEAADPAHPAIELYARARLGLDSFVVPDGPRFGHAGLGGWVGDETAILVPVVRGDRIVGVQRIFVNDKGEPAPARVYADSDPVRKAAKGRLTGGAAMMGNPAGTLVLCEGVETAWAIHHATGLAVWACVSTSGLVNVEIPTDVLERVDRVVFAADCDRLDPNTNYQPGHEFARRGAARLAEMHPTAVIAAVAPDFDAFPDLVDPDHTPAAGAKSVDWLDVLLAHGPSAVAKQIRGAERLAGRNDEHEDPQRSKPRNAGRIMPADDLDRARRCIVDEFSPPETRRRDASVRLIYLDGGFYLHNGSRYRALDREGRAVRQLVRRWAAPMDSVKFRATKHDRERYYTPAGLAKTSLDAVVAAMADELLALRDDEYQHRFWFEPFFDEQGTPLWPDAYSRVVESPAARALPDPDMLIPLPSGLFDAEAWCRDLRPRLIPHSERFFCENLVGHDLRPADFDVLEDGDLDDLREYAWTMCPLWREYLAQAFGEGDFDRARADIHELHKVLGYYLLPDVSRHQGNIVWLAGPPGTGKGTLITVVQTLLGQLNCVSSRIDQLADGPHMSAWIGKLLAVFADTDASSKIDKRLVVEVMKLVSGGDSVSLRKLYKDPIPGLVLFTRMMLAVNTLPQLPDPTGAFSRRSIFFGFKTPVGTPNPDLTKGKRLLLQPESLRGILLLAICGLADLAAEGFGLPPSGASLAEQFRKQSTEFDEFVKACLAVLEPGQGEGVFLAQSDIVEAFGLYRRVALGRDSNVYAPDTVMSAVVPLLQARGWKGAMHTEHKAKGPYFYTHLALSDHVEELRDEERSRLAVTAGTGAGQRAVWEQD